MKKMCIAGCTSFHHLFHYWFSFHTIRTPALSSTVMSSIKLGKNWNSKVLQGRNHIFEFFKGFYFVEFSHGGVKVSVIPTGMTVARAKSTHQTS